MGRTPKEVQLAVRGRIVTISRTLVELRDTPPSEWAVVHPTGGRESYMVCPGCRHRAQLPDRHVDTMRCPRCNAAFAIAWGGVPALLSLAAQGLKPDRRATRRRTLRERRIGRERRSTARGASLPRRSGQRRALLDRRRRSASR